MQVFGIDEYLARWVHATIQQHALYKSHVHVHVIEHLFIIGAVLRRHILRVAETVAYIYCLVRVHDRVNVQETHVHEITVRITRRKLHQAVPVVIYVAPAKAPHGAVTRAVHALTGCRKVVNARVLPVTTGIAEAPAAPCIRHAYTVRQGGPDFYSHFSGLPLDRVHTGIYIVGMDTEHTTNPTSPPEDTMTYYAVTQDRVGCETPISVRLNANLVDDAVAEFHGMTRPESTADGTDIDDEMDWYPDGTVTEGEYAEKLTAEGFDRVCDLGVNAIDDRIRWTLWAKTT